jgi:NADPH:quinone reductase-like Zn-dependent oxidoreductase
MGTIQAVIVDAGAPGHLKLGGIDAPSPASGEALVRVHALSLNRGEVRAAQRAADGSRTGWDIAGVVEQAAAEGGPPAGARVVGVLRTAAWAELVAVPVGNLAVLPPAVSFAQAATLPVAGLTALYALDRADGLVARNVLVTGASGGVGHFAVQLAREGGANVAGLVRQQKHAQSVSEAGASHVVVDETGAAAREDAPYHHVLESVGGDVLGNVIGMMAPFGQIVVYGVSAGGPVSFDSSLALRSRFALSGLAVFTEMNRETASVGLGRLARMVAAGTLKPLIAVEAPWTEIGSVAQQLIDRAYPGKAVLHVS